LIAQNKSSPRVVFSRIAALLHRLLIGSNRESAVGLLQDDPATGFAV